MTSSRPPPTYKDQTAWREIQKFLPDSLQLTSDGDLPQEEAWGWEGHEVHIERWGEGKDSPVNLILLHGVGTNGRQMSLLVGGPLAKRGISSVAVDLPGYGVTRVNPKAQLRYGDWVRCVSAFVDAEAARDASKPIVLYGLSAGGMLAYQVAAINNKVKGIVGMTFLDQRDPKVAVDTAYNALLGRIGIPSFMAKTAGSVKLPMKMVSKMYALVNNPKALKVFLADSSSAGNWVTVRFLQDYLTYGPAVEPEEFTTCPILLTQPAADEWTPLELGEIFLRRVKKVPVKVAMLENAGHYPLEQPGIDQLHEAIVSFVTAIGKGESLDSQGFKLQG